MSIMRRIRRTAVVAAAGAASAYFLDPAEGEARRRAVTDRLRGVMQMAAESTGQAEPTGRAGSRTGLEDQAPNSAGSGPSPASGAMDPFGSASGPDVMVPPVPAPEMADGPGHPSAPLPPLAG